MDRHETEMESGRVRWSKCSACSLRHDMDPEHCTLQ